MHRTLLTHLPDATSIFVKGNGKAPLWQLQLLPIYPVQVPKQELFKIWGSRKN